MFWDGVSIMQRWKTEAVWRNREFIGDKAHLRKTIWETVCEYGPFTCYEVGFILHLDSRTAKAQLERLEHIGAVLYDPTTDKFTAVGNIDEYNDFTIDEKTYINILHRDPGRFYWSTPRTKILPRTVQKHPPVSRSRRNDYQPKRRHIMTKDEIVMAQKAHFESHKACFKAKARYLVSHPDKKIDPACDGRD